MDISQLRQKIYFLKKRRNKLETKLMRTKPMIAGSLSMVYNVCGNPTCKCKRGERHGPYPLLSLKINGKKTSRFVKKRDIKKIERQVEEYRKFQKGVTHLKEINNQIQKYYQQIREIQCIELE